VIHISRAKAPDAFAHSSLKKEATKASRFFKDKKASKRLQVRFEFFPLMSVREIRTALLKTFRAKCAYCESPVSTESAEISHFRPQSGAMNSRGRMSPDHYWWLAYEWENAYLTCAPCKRSKGDYFPIRANKRAPPGTLGISLRREYPFLLDPCFDQPERHLAFHASGEVEAKTSRGKASVALFDLNRADLVGARLLEAERLKARWESLTRSQIRGSISGPEVLTEAVVSEWADPNAPFLSLRCQFLQRRLASLPKRDPIHVQATRFITAVFAALRFMGSGLTKAGKPLPKTTGKIALRGTSPRRIVVTRYHAVTHRRRIEWIELRNFKAIHKLTISFQGKSGPDNWRVLLGKNAAGKSSILQAVALTLMGQRERARLCRELHLKPSGLLRKGAPSGSVRIKLSGHRSAIELGFRKGVRGFSTNQMHRGPVDMFVLGYSTTRLLPGFRKVRPPSNDIVKLDNLFDPFLPLRDAGRWLLGRNKREFGLVARGIKDLLSIQQRAQLIPEGTPRQIKVRAFGHSTSLEALSSGYQSVLAMAMDIMAFLRGRGDVKGKRQVGWETMQHAQGLVLIDELRPTFILLGRCESSIPYGGRSNSCSSW
jgi:uncharacterized protein (TIGR02646 family)